MGDEYGKNGASLGFGMALAQNEAAMQAFEQLSPGEKRKILEKTHTVSSKGEMRALVGSLLESPHTSFG